MKKKDLEQKAKKLSKDEMDMIDKYSRLQMEIEVEYKRKVQEVEKKEKEMWKKELELKSKKKEYEDSIRMVKQKIIEESSI